MSVFRLLDIHLTHDPDAGEQRRRWRSDRQFGDPRGDPRMRRRARSSATSPRRRLVPDRLGRPDRVRLPSSLSGRRPARRRTCRGGPAVAPRQPEEPPCGHPDRRPGPVREPSWRSIPGSCSCDPPAVRTSADFVDLVAETSPHDLLNALFTDDYHDDDLNQLLGRAIDGDQSAAKELAGKLPEWQKGPPGARCQGRRRHHGGSSRCSRPGRGSSARSSRESRPSSSATTTARAADRDRLRPADLHRERRPAACAICQRPGSPG